MVPDYDLSKAEKLLINKENDFSLRLFRQLAAGKDGKNQVYSPLGALYLLNMTATGATGETRGEICKALGISEKEIEAFNKFAHRQMLSLAIDSPQVSVGSVFMNRSYLKSANIIATEGSDYFKEDYRAKMEQDYFAGVIEGRFDEEMQKRLDDWCNEQTAGMIPRMPLKVDRDTKLLLVNANNFAGVWPEEFSEARPKPFYEGTSSKVSMMSKIDKEKYSSVCKHANFSLLNTHYTGGFNMQIILPDSLVDLRAFIDRLSMEELRAAQGKLKTYEEVHISIPKFEAATDMSLKELLRQLGMHKAFGDDAELVNISDKPLKINKIQQQTKIKVDEWGTTAESVTGTEFAELSLVIAKEENIAYFEANRPFVYLIYDPFGAICYIGTYHGE